jgi:hypothetical protein
MSLSVWIYSFITWKNAKENGDFGEGAGSGKRLATAQIQRRE